MKSKTPAKSPYEKERAKRFELKSGEEWFRGARVTRRSRAARSKSK